MYNIIVLISTPNEYKGQGVQFLYSLDYWCSQKFKAHTHKYIHDVPELSALSEGGGVISLEGDREWRPTREERGEGEGVWGSMIVWKLFIAAMETCKNS